MYLQILILRLQTDQVTRFYHGYLLLQFSNMHFSSHDSMMLYLLVMRPPVNDIDTCHSAGLHYSSLLVAFPFDDFVYIVL